MIYEFSNQEVIALDNYFNDTCTLLEKSREVTKKLSSHLDLEDTKEILLLHTSINNIFNGCNYQLGNLRKFNAAISKEAKILFSSDNF